MSAITDNNNQITDCVDNIERITQLHISKLISILITMLISIITTLLSAIFITVLSTTLNSIHISILISILITKCASLVKHKTQIILFSELQSKQEEGTPNFPSLYEIFWPMMQQTFAYQLLTFPLLFSGGTRPKS